MLLFTLPQNGVALRFPPHSHIWLVAVPPYGVLRKKTSSTFPVRIPPRVRICPQAMKCVLRTNEPTRPETILFMKIHKLLLNFAAAFVMTATLPGHAESWQGQVLAPVPAFAPAGGGITLLLDTFASDPANPVVFLGTTDPTYGNPTILRLTPNTASPDTFDVEAVDNGLSYVSRLLWRPSEGVNGTLYAVGHGPNDPKARNPVSVWTVRKSSGNGAVDTWSQDEKFFLTKNAYSIATGATTDQAGNLFVAGVANDGRTPHLIIRRKTPVGTWATVYDAKGQNADMMPSMCFYPGIPGDLQRPPARIVASELNSKWIVLRSVNQGASGSWQLVDSWTGGGAAATAYDVAYDEFSGNIYAVGCRGLNGSDSPATAPSAWVIRVSIDGGVTWNPLLDIAGMGSWASRVACDADGNVSVSGVVNPTYKTATKPLWKVIHCTEPLNPLNWLTSFDNTNSLFPFGETVSKGRGIIADPGGNLFATGYVADWTDWSDSQNPVIYPGTRAGLVRLTPLAPTP
jgi:hypothetical protein